MRTFLIALTRSPISLIGTAITSLSACMIAVLFAIEIAGFRGNPYIGILAYLVLPAFFLLGLLLIPVGILYERRHGRLPPRGTTVRQVFPVIDLNVKRVRTMLLTFLGFTFLNVVILSAAMYKGVEVMESTEFCGETCHSVMHPENTAYARSPHSRVDCVSCHIGPGADWFVKSKMSGAWQVVATTFDLYPRPIPTPIHNLRPARETCEQCHWPTKFVGDRLKVITHYGDDETATKSTTVLLMRVGGTDGRRSHGIHWHVDPGNRIRYRSDERRETIYEVEQTLADGSVRLFSTGETAGDANGDVEPGAGPGEWRTMDCVDCHNRPTHVYKLPEREVDDAIGLGLIDRSLPYVRRESARALRGEYGSHEEARAGIAAALAAFYRDGYPDLFATRAEDIERLAELVGDIYCVNVFPTMKVDWGTYPDHIGHMDFPGCFRCHDDEHRTTDGEVISQDCETCHSLLAMEEEDPEILRQLNP